MVAELWINAVLHVVVAVAFIAVGRQVMRPDVARDRVARSAFASWWLLYAAQSLVEAVRIAVVAAGSRDAALFQGMFQAQNIVAVAALWGLGAYVQYISRGERWGWLPWGTFLAALAAWYTWIVSRHQFATIDAGAWQPTFTLVHPMQPITQLLLVTSYYAILLGLGLWLVLLAGGSEEAVVRRRALALMATLLILSVEGIASLGLQMEVAASGLLNFARLPAAMLVYWAYLEPRRPR